MKLYIIQVNHNKMGNKNHQLPTPTIHFQMAIIIIVIC